MIYLNPLVSDITNEDLKSLKINKPCNQINLNRKQGSSYRIYRISLWAHQYYGYGSNFVCPSSVVHRMFSPASPHWPFLTSQFPCGSVHQFLAHSNISTFWVRIHFKTNLVSMECPLDWFPLNLFNCDNQRHVHWTLWNIFWVKADNVPFIKPPFHETRHDRSNKFHISKHSV